MIAKYLSAVATTIAIGCGVAACGDDGRSHEAFVTDVNRVCKVHTEERGEIAAKHFTDDQPPTVQQLQAFYADFAPRYARTAERLADSESDDDHADTYADYVAAFRRHAQTLTRAGGDAELTKHLLETDEAELHEGEELVKKLGTSPDC